MALKINWDGVITIKLPKDADNGTAHKTFGGERVQSERVQREYRVKE